MSGDLATREPAAESAETLGLLASYTRPGHPDFLDLPWHLPLSVWRSSCRRLVEVERGLSRHEVVFVSYPPAVYALKELPVGGALREHGLLAELEKRRLPAVAPVGHARTRTAVGEELSVLVTRYLDDSIPYRTLFQNPGLERYRDRLLDAVAGLLVRLHLAGFYWGDCSLSNTLFRRDAGELRAWFVDAETSACGDSLTDAERSQDLLIMEGNLAGELAQVAAPGAAPSPIGPDTGRQVRERYERLWGEITREETLCADESYRIQERIRALNALGFSVGEVELVATGERNRLRMRTIVTDRDYHRHQLHTLTGIVAGDRQAERMLNEIHEIKAMLAREPRGDAPLGVAAYHWMRERYEPVVRRLAALGVPGDAPELYCQVLEHKWYLSERARHDVGLERALEDYLDHVHGAAAAGSPS
ncbi:MAG TPA: DUF4032 domain-containing protein [Candidatus Eisenbacteria bacterium]|jgi:hypothetical protein